jgi:hypothetical protein
MSVTWKPDEHRASRMPDGVAPIDPLFHEAAASGFEPLSDEARESFREKAGIFRKVVGGKG